MYKTILVPLDASAFAEEALPMAALLAKTVGAELHLVHVIRPSYDVDFKTPQEDLAWRQEIRDGAERYLEEHAAALRTQGLSALTAVMEGGVGDALTAYADEQEVDLVVITTHGSGGVQRWWLGSVADELIRTGTTDLMLVRPWDDTSDREKSVSRFRRVLVPVDGSRFAEGALERARALSQRFEGRVRALRVVPQPLELTSIYGMPGVEFAGAGHDARLEEAEEYIKGLVGKYDDPAVNGGVIEGVGAAEGVIEAAKEWDADLLTLSSHGRGGTERVVLGSVADKIIRGTTRPVLVVRAADES